MLYDQAQLLAVYGDYHTITGEFDVIEDIVSYVDVMLTVILHIKYLFL